MNDILMGCAIGASAGLWLSAIAWLPAMSERCVGDEVNRCRQCGWPVRDNYDLCDTHDVERQAP